MTYNASKRHLIIKVIGHTLTYYSQCNESKHLEHNRGPCFRRHSLILWGRHLVRGHETVLSASFLHKKKKNTHTHT